MGCYPKLRGELSHHLVVETRTAKSKELTLHGSVSGRILTAVKLDRIFGLGIWLACAAAPGGLHAALAPEKLYQKVLPSVMTLEVENQSGQKFVGSAVLARTSDVALTAWHVVADARSVWAVFADGQRVKVVGCIDHNGGRDLAILKLEKRLPRRQAALCQELQSVAARAYVIGAPKGYDFSISDGLISQVRNINGFLQYQLSCPISPGNSGGPILNNRGEVIGIASWMKADAQNVSFAIPIREFMHLNISQPPRTWEELTATACAAPPARLSASGHRTDMTLQGTPDTRSFAAFKSQLNQSAGKSVTVVLQEESRTNTFTFIVK
jgi:S1-C subfamily serine protease